MKTAFRPGQPVRLKATGETARITHITTRNHGGDLYWIAGDWRTADELETL